LSQAFGFLPAALGVAALPVYSIAAEAGPILPTGGQFVAGSGAIVSNSSSVNINQATTKGVINWQQFSIGNGGAVQINNGEGATLNRVIGNNVSEIAGSLSATGSVYVVNQAGVIVAPGGKVVTGGNFVASTRDISTTNFMSSDVVSAQGSSTGAVVNNGSIKSANGDVALIGKSVTNNGSIAAPNGTATLAAGDTVSLTVSIPGTNNSPQIQITNGSGDVTNTGTIQAAQAILNAAGGNIYALATNNGGLIRATGTVSKDGHVYLTAGQNVEVDGTIAASNADGSGGTITTVSNGTTGNVTVAGKLNASANTQTKGGNITVTGSNVTIESSASISANGGTNGGTIVIGGDRHGGNTPSLNFSATPVPNAQTTTVHAGAQISADGGTDTNNGNGGNIVVWSNRNTNFDGEIYARGGADGGNGGYVETSGEFGLAVGLDAQVNTLAPMGLAGNWLLDPENIVIQSGGSTTPVTSEPYSSNPTATVTLAPSAIQGASSNVTLQASTDITINSAVTMQNSVVLTLDAGRSIAINANIKSPGGFADLINDSNVIAADRLAGQAQFAMTAGTSISTTPTSVGVAGGAISIATGTFGGGGDAYVGGITIASLNASSKTSSSSAGAGGDITIVNSEGNIVSDSTGTITISANGSGPPSGMASGGTIQITANGNVGRSSASLGAISATGGGSSGGLVTLVSGGSIWNGAISSGISGVIESAPNGSITISANSWLNTTTLTANSASGIVTLEPVSAGTPMSLAGPGSLNFTVADLANVTANTLVLGSTTATGGLTIGTSVSLPSTLRNLSLINKIVTVSSSVGLTDGASAGNITVQANKLTLNTSASLNASNGSISIIPVSTSEAVSVGGSSDPGSDLFLSSAEVNQIATPTLTIGSMGDTGTLKLIGVLSLASGIANFDLLTGGAISLNAGSKLTGASGSNLVLATGTSFTNNAGGSALAASGAGRWLVYSQNPVDDNKGSLPYSFKQYGTSYPSAPTPSTGNGFLYTVAPIITVSLQNTVSKTYDGTATATLNASNYSISGAIDGDTVTLNDPTVGSYADRNVGTGKIVSVSGLSILSATNGSATVYGYALSGSSISGAVGVINPEALTITASANTKTYDGTTSALAIPTITSGVLQGSDTDTLSEVYASKNVGTGLTLIPTAVINDGNGGNNYAVSLVDNFNGVINPKLIVVSGLSAPNRSYNASSTESVAGTPTLASFELPGTGNSGDGVPYNGDAVAIGGSVIGTFADPNVGNEKPVTITGLALTGPQATNYLLAPLTLSANIDPLVINVSGTRPYDGTTNASATILTITNNLDGANLTLAGNGILTNPNVGFEQLANAGTLSLLRSAAPNYTVSGVTGGVVVTATSGNPGQSSGAPPPNTGTITQILAVLSGGTPLPSGTLILAANNSLGVIALTAPTTDNEQDQGGLLDLIDTTAPDACTARGGREKLVDGKVVCVVSSDDQGG